MNDSHQHISFFEIGALLLSSVLVYAGWQNRNNPCKCSGLEYFLPFELRQMVLAASPSRPPSTPVRLHPLCAHIVGYHAVAVVLFSGHFPSKRASGFILLFGFLVWSCSLLFLHVVLCNFSFLQDGVAPEAKDNARERVSVAFKGVRCVCTSMLQVDHVEQ